ncbi:MAG: hypothetical protein CVU89_04975 [Firmicutes bacterium HGW-Firmicutes-14]|nr:MAG: hypothetical protein CVU89_04975 [Firmicutes bacterium HGW-Firmicutes-14]
MKGFSCTGRSWLNLNNKENTVLFDLDDTLFPVIRFCAGGYMAVGTYLESCLHIPAERFRELCLRLLVEKGSTGRIFNEVLGCLGVSPGEQERLVPHLVSLYRDHSPCIGLYPDVLPVISLLKQRYNLGIITDGDPLVQRKKIGALGLENMMQVIIYTWEKGSEFGKPDPASFLEAAERLGVPPEKAVYVGDNPHKDFTGAKKAGLYTVRVRRGLHRRVNLGSGAEAHMEISRFKELPEALEKYF